MKIQNNCILNIANIIAIMAAILNFFKQHLPNHMLNSTESRQEASGQQRDTELLKPLNSDILDGCHSGSLGIHQTILPPAMLVRLH